MKNKKLIIGLSILLLVCAIYAAGFLYFKNHFYPNTFVNEVEVSNLDLDKANNKLSILNPYLKVIQKNKNGTDTITEEIQLKELSDDISYDASKLLENQNPLLWFINVFNKHEQTCNKITGNYSEEKLDDLSKKLYCLKQENIIEPKDAYLSYENGEFVINKEVDGTYIKKDRVINLLKEALYYFEQGQDNTLDLTSKYETASIKQDDESLQRQKKEFETMLEKTITINVDSNRVITLSGNELFSLYTISDNKLTYNDETVNNYIANIAYNYNKSSYYYIDKASFKNDLIYALNNKDSSVITLKWIEEKTGLIEVVISEQTLYYYENGALLLTSPVVTGNAQITGPTPTGKFRVTRMNTNSTLSGADYTEHVDYWIGFDETGRIYGFHDASWRSEFGGDIYLSDPSRGCVNMPLNKISLLYGYVSLGTEVYIH